MEGGVCVSGMYALLSGSGVCILIGGGVMGG